MKRLLLYLFAVLALLLVIFLIQNAETVQLNFLFWSITTSRSFLVLGILLLGMVVGWLLGRMKGRPRSVAAPPASPPAKPNQEPGS